MLAPSVAITSAFCPQSLEGWPASDKHANLSCGLPCRFGAWIARPQDVTYRVALVRSVADTAFVLSSTVCSVPFR